MGGIGPRPLPDDARDHGANVMRVERSGMIGFDNDPCGDTAKHFLDLKTPKPATSSESWPERRTD